MKGWVFALSTEMTFWLCAAGILLFVLFIVAFARKLKRMDAGDGGQKRKKAARREPAGRDFSIDSIEYYIDGIAAGVAKSLPCAFCAFAGEDGRLKEKAAAAFAKALDDAAAAKVFSFYASMRSYGIYGTSWKDKKLDGFFTSGMDEKGKTAVCIFASFHPDGYIREQAVKALMHTEGALPFLMIRLNDWVREVRAAAKAAYEYRLAACKAEELIKSVSYAERAFGGNKQQMRAFADVLMRNEDIFAAGLSSPDMRTRRFCIDSFFLYGDISPEAEVRLLQGEPTSFLRYRIYSKAVGRSEFNKDVILFGLNDKNPKLRHEALISAWNKNYIDIEPVKQALIDKNAGIREFAQNVVLANNPLFDISGYYRGFPGVPAAIAGLGEMGDRSDCGLLEQYLSNERADIVRAAMKSLCQLDFDAYAGKVAEMLDDGRCGIVREAYRLLTKRTGGTLYTVNRIYKKTGNANTKIKCAMLLFRSSKWGGLAYMLQALSDRDIAELAAKETARWLSRGNRSFIAPSFSEKKQLLSLIDNNKALLGENLTKQLLFSLGENAL